MIARIATAFLALAAATAVGATAIPRGYDSCNTGPVQCCNSVQSAKSAGVAALLGLLNIAVQNADTMVGITCSPITVIGAAGNGCNAQTVCCEDNSHGGLVSIGCAPVQAGSLGSLPGL